MKSVVALVFLLALLLFVPEVYAQGFNPNAVFPAWGGGGQVQGVLGSNSGDITSGSGRLIIYFIPKVIEILILVTAPIVFVMFILAGLKFIYAAQDEEQVKKARDFFRYGVVGILFIVISYSLMKAIYFIFA